MKQGGRETGRILAAVAAACAVLMGAILGAVPAQAQATLAAVKKRGEIRCGINGQLPGFSVKDDKGQWVGFEIDFCRAVAAAVIGDAKRVKFVPLTTQNRFDALRKDEIDVLARNTTATLGRISGTGVRAGAVIYVDGQSMVVPKRLNVSELGRMDKTTVCILDNTPYLERLEDWFAVRKITFKPVMFANQEAMYAAFFNGTCDGVTQDISALASTIIASGKAADYVMLPDIVATDPLAPYVLAGDDQWLDTVRWTHYVMVEAEEHGITQLTVDTRRQTGTPVERRLLGAIPGNNAPKIGLEETFPYEVIKQVGNYGELYERNIGAGSPLKFRRGINALWRQGGAMYSLPMR
jgi:general L-amino acid transport system substrate-binding protein